MKSSFLVSMVLVACSGCGVFATKRDLETARAETKTSATESREEIARLRSQLDATRERLENALRANADSGADLVASRQRLAELAGRGDEMAHALEELRKDIAASRTEMHARLDALQRSQPAPATPPPPPAATVPADRAAHWTALEGAYDRKEWPAVRNLGTEFVNRYPTDDKSDNAIYLLGSADLHEGRASSALGQFNRLLRLFPKSEVLDKTLFDMGEAYLSLHDCENARLAFTSCETRFSKERIGAEAKKKLETIKKRPSGLCGPQ